RSKRELWQRRESVGTAQSTVAPRTKRKPEGRGAALRDRSRLAPIPYKGTAAVGSFRGMGGKLRHFRSRALIRDIADGDIHRCEEDDRVPRWVAFVPFQLFVGDFVFFPDFTMRSR